MMSIIIQQSKMGDERSIQVHKQVMPIIIPSQYTPRLINQCSGR